MGISNYNKDLTLSRASRNTQLQIFSFIIGIAICVSALSAPSHAQPISNATTQIPAAQHPVRIQGIVTDRKKYSFTVMHNDTQYTVKLAPGAPVGLKMNKPWFDWENEQVVVDAMNFPADPKSDPANQPKRVAIKLPAKKLFLISRLGDAARIKETMSAETKRINFYLLTPDDPGQHLPTEKEPYLSGALSVKDNNVHVEVNEQMLAVLLGFRFATMNGFSMVQLEPNRTQVFLSGTWADGETEILATSVLFQPVVAPQTVTSNPVDRNNPFAKQ